MDEIREYLLRRRITRLNQQIWEDTLKLNKLRKDLRIDKKELKMMITKDINQGEIKIKRLSNAEIKKIQEYNLCHS